MKFVMKGRRLPILTFNEIEDPDSPNSWSKPKLNTPQNPGEYCGPIIGYTGDVPAVFFLKPNSRDEGVKPIARAVQHVCSPPHKFTEEVDGTLTITASISDKRIGGTESDGWHGYLTKGDWYLA